MAQGIIIQIHHVSSAIGVQQIQNWTNIHFSKILLKKKVLQVRPSLHLTKKPYQTTFVY